MLNQWTTNRFLAVFLRLSIVVAVVCAAWEAWRLLKEHERTSTRSYELIRGYDCAARMPDAELKKHLAPSGNINVRPLGCAGRDFWVSEHEIALVRSGKQINSPPTPIDWSMTVPAALVGFIATNLFALALASMWRVGRWVLGI